MEGYNTTHSTEPLNFVKEGVKVGLINSAIALLLLYVSYFMGLNAFVSTQFATGFIPYMIVILIVYGIQMRRRNGNYLGFKDALQFSFMSYVVVAVIMAIGTYILYNLVDKDLTQKSFDLSFERTRAFFERLKVDPKEIDKQMDKMEKQETTVRNIILGVGLGLIWDFVKSLLVTLIIRREKPVI
ncbi:MAG: DUF4199 family protein [Flavisolibacter sp.]